MSNFISIYTFQELDIVEFRYDDQRHLVCYSRELIFDREQIKCIDGR